MFKCCRVGGWVQPVVWVAVLLIPAMLFATDVPKNGRNRAKFEGEKIDIFAGIEKGLLEVRLIPQNEKKSRLLITNKTDRPLSVQLPAALAGVPVLAQFNMPMQQQNTPQAVGGGQQAPFFNIAPEKVGKLTLRTVCLNHGKTQPLPRIKYELKPIGEVATKPGVAEICTLLGKGAIGQRVAQLAAWHLENGKSWEELQSKTRQGAFVKIPQYSRAEINAARKLAEKAVEMAQNGEKEKSY